MNIKIEKSGNVYLNSESFKRMIGRLEDDTFYCKRLSKHFHQLLGSWGFNYELVKHQNIKFICVELETGEFIWTTKRVILEMGVVKYFKKQGFEIQIFLKSEFFRKTKQLADELENSLNTQPDDHVSVA